MKIFRPFNNFTVTLYAFRNVSRMGTPWVRPEPWLSDEEWAALSDVELFTSERCVLSNVYWREETNDIYNQTGIQPATSAKIQIELDPAVSGLEYVTPAQWYSLIDAAGFWSIDKGRLAPYTWIVKGECPFVFTPSTMAELSRQMPEFQKQYPDAKRIKFLDVQDYGTKAFWHVQIRTE
jgi:hypothetical protein